MNVKNVKRFQTVTIWVGDDDAYRVSGYYRAALHGLGKFATLESAFNFACKVKRSQATIGVVPFDDGGNA